MQDDAYSEPPAIERRSHPRLQRRIAVEILNMGDDPSVPFHQEVLHGDTHDLSVGGLRIVLPYDIREGAEIAVVLRAGQQFQAFLAFVVWKMREREGTIYGMSAPRLHPDRLV